MNNKTNTYSKTIRKVLTLFVFLVSSLELYAQNEGIDWPEKMIAYSLEKQHIKCRELADYILSIHSKEYSPREARAMAIGAYAYSDINPQRASEIVSYVYKPLVDDMLADKNKFHLMNRERKKKYIQNFTDNYEFVVGLSLLVDLNDSANVSKLMDLFIYYHENIFENRNIFDSSDQLEAFYIATIIRQESHFFKFFNRYNTLLLELYPELIALKKDNCPIIDIAIFNAINNFRDKIIEFGLTKQGKKYIEERTNFLLQYNDLCLNNMGFEAANNYNIVNWKEICNSLGKKECAVIMYDYNHFSATSIIFFCGIVISPKFEKPKELCLSMESLSPDVFLKALESEFPDYERYYICPIGNWEDKDIAYINSKIYMKHSLYDLVRYPKSLKYDGGILSLFADIEFGEKNTTQDDFVVPLDDGIKIIGAVKTLFGNKVYSLSGKKVKKINFLNIIDNVSIFHISTHGRYNSFFTNISPKDTIGFYNSILGYTSLMNFGLALSDYNVNNKNNFVSAKDVIDYVKFTGNQIVYLDACKTGNTKENIFGVNGLAKAFYFAGARNVISYITEVKEIIATDFALCFYFELNSNPNATYHDIFYKVKQTIIDRYKDDFLCKDSYGRPDIGIILWE